MLYDDLEQLEVRHVISLAHHDVGIYGGGGDIPEGELWIRRNAICLTRRLLDSSSSTDSSAPEPFYLFSDNCSEKEDFYLALLQNQHRNAGGQTGSPSPQRFDVQDIISLVQRLHSSEEHMQTRWFNGMVGRLFLALYKTTEIEHLIRTKITKKIARVKKPAFLSDVVVQKIDMGRGPPYITNPRLKDLTVDGECAVEMDVDYSGHFKIEVATKARIELGSRFKAREVDLVLSVVLKKLEGHCIARIKPPPSNRIWFTFVTMPKMQMSIEPIVSSRQITYNIILRAIESRVREVIAETVVSPNWDDIPFSDTTDQRFRGGIWAQETGERTEGKEAAAENVENERHDPEKMLDESQNISPKPVDSGPVADTTHTSALPDTPRPLPSRRPTRQSQSRGDGNSPLSSSGETPRRLERKGSWRSGSYASTGTPVVATDKTTVDAVRGDRHGEQHDAASVMFAISTRSQPTSPVESPVGSPSNSAEPSDRGSYSSSSTKRSKVHGKRASQNSTDSSESNPLSTTAASKNGGSVKSLPGFGYDSKSNRSTVSLAQGLPGASPNRTSLSTLSAATVSVARKWGWGAKKEREHGTDGDDPAETAREGTPSNPIGRGRPLPPPGTPLPLPDTYKAKRPISIAPKRKPVPPIAPLQRQDTNQRPPVTPLPPISTYEATNEQTGEPESLLVVAAPSDSLPSTPVRDEQSDFSQPFAMDEDVSGLEREAPSHKPSGDSTPFLYLQDASVAHSVAGTASFPDQDEDHRASWNAGQETATHPAPVSTGTENQHL